MISIKWASNLLVFACVVITATVCSVLSISSSNDAISKTENNRDVSVNECFSYSSGVIKNRTEVYLEVLSQSVVDTIAKHFTTHHALTRMVLSEMLAGDDDQRDSWDFLWSKRSVFTNLYTSYYDSGVAAVGVVNRNDALLYVLEDIYTIPLEVRHDILMVNNGSEYDIPGIPTKKRLGWGTVQNLTGDFANPGEQYATADVPCNEWRYNPWKPMVPCYGKEGDPEGAYLVSVFGRLVQPGLDSLTFTPPISFGPYLGILCYGTYYNSKGEYVGLTYTALDVRIMDQFLQTLDIPGRGRVFTVVKENNWLRMPVDLHLTGVSHGYSGKGNATHSETLPAREASDLIIRETAVHIEDALPGKYNNLTDKGVYEADLATGEGGQNETFYILVHTFDNKRQIQWYVVTVLDREYVLGDVDVVTEQTRNGIAASSEAVSDDLKGSRIILIVVIGVVAVLLLAAGFAAITTVTKPILLLKSEMASIAVMRIEDVDEARGLSRLSEVAQMQQSFLKMIENLREYRNYMPQSVLVSSTDDDVDNDLLTDQLTTTIGSTDSDSRSRTLTYSAIGSPKDMAVRQRKVTIAITNAVHFCTDAGLQHHREYISLALKQCTQNGGVPDFFSGDRFIMMFNGPKTCTGHAVQAANSCMGIIAHAPYVISAAVSSGQAKCGNMGCEGLKKFSVIGSVYAVTMTLERINRVLETKLLCCPSSQRDINRTFYTRLEDQLWYPKFKGDRLMAIFSVIAEKQLSQEEWMYQLQGCEDSNPAKIHNEVMSFYCTKEYEAALAILGHDASYQRLKEKILKARETGINCIRNIATELI
eukprot:TRINITY_DN5120_c1_g1_i1.p1 TRINITY_DN5120_c1_g1~~TRINITY_DN5120_c1_g1_i1.p1  ORF type:complete len:817 (+),score=155.73 TRINITY_DN5120_c1_g1_i1:77-2527(+)